MRRGKRSAFTLVEMLVVIGILLVLAALAAAFMPRYSESSRVTDAANQIQAWMIGAKLRAHRDGVVSGIRFFADNPNNPVTASTAQFVEQPSPITGGSTLAVQQGQPIPPAYLPYGKYNYMLNGVQMTGTLCINGGMLMNGVYDEATDTTTVTFGPTNLNNGQPCVDFSLGGLPPNQWLVQVGDSLALKDGSVHLITGIVVPPAGQNACQLLFANVSNGHNRALAITDPTANFAIYRQVRAMPGELPIGLPRNTLIDLAAMKQYGMVLPSRIPGAYDLLFEPRGSVWSGNVGQYILWVRAFDVIPSQSDNHAQALIVVRIRGGECVVRDVATGPNPFAFANQ